MNIRRRVPIAILLCLNFSASSRQTDSQRGDSVRIRVTDGSPGKPLPCRITIVDSNGMLARIDAGKSPHVAIRPGVIYTGNGEARINLVPGSYTIYATRGPEYSLAKRVVRSTSSETSVDLRLEREVDMSGYVSCDTHIHTLTYSGHGDAEAGERAVTLAGEGIIMPVSTEHNRNVDYAPHARAAGVDRWFTPVAGNEVTTNEGHFNIFPIAKGAAAPDYYVTDWKKLIPALRATPGVRVVVLNHPSNNHSGFVPTDPKRFHPLSGESLDGRPWTMDAVEVINSSAHQSDYMKPFRDWFALLNHGLRATGVASSDCHDVNQYIVSQARTYIAGVSSARPDSVDVEKACSNLLAGHALISFGLVTEAWVDGSAGPGDLAKTSNGKATVRVRVRGPSWIAADRLDLYMNGEKVLSKPIVHSRDAVVKLDEELQLPLRKHDAWLVAIATGPGVKEPYWPVSRPYQPKWAEWEPVMIGATNPIYVDSDGDGKYSSPLDYAKSLLDKSGDNRDRLIEQLSDYDEAVAVQAFAMCHAKGADVRDGKFQAAIRKAAPQVEQAYKAYIYHLPAT